MSVGQRGRLTVERLTAVPTDRHGRVHPPCSRENGGSEVARVDHQNLVLDQGRGAFQPSVTGLARTRARKCRMSMKAARLRGSGYVESSVAARLPNRRDWLGRRGRGFEACRSIQLSYGRTRKISEIANAYCSTTYGPDSQPQLPLIGCILRVGNRRFLDPRKSQLTDGGDTDRRWGQAAPRVTRMRDSSRQL